MLAELLFVGVQYIQPPIQPRVIDLPEGHSQQILQRAVRIPTLRHLQFALLAAEAR
jgi:hypothetical protein